MFEQISLLSMLDNNEEVTLSDSIVNNYEINSVCSLDKDFSVNEEVFVEYERERYLGIVCRIYNEGESLSCSFDGRQTCFHKSKVFKIK